MQQVFIYDWAYENDEESHQTLIRCFALNEKNETVCLNIEDFSPYLYLELPTNIQWGRGQIDHLRNDLEKIFFPYQPIATKLVKRRKLYYAHFDKDKKPKQYYYLQFYFETAQHFRSIGFKLNKPFRFNGRQIQLKVHEHNASPILQLVCSQNLKTTGWVEFNGEVIDEEKEKISRCDHEYNISYSSLKSIEKDTLPDAMVLSYDIEVYSSNPNVMPNPSKPEDVIFQISMVFSQGSKRYKYLLTLGDPKDELVGEDAIVVKFRSEAMLIKEFGKLIIKHNPQIITGYNIYGFDYPYMMGRAVYNKVSGSLHRCGMLKDKECPRKEINWASSAYGKQELCFIEMEGRITIDLLTLVRREFKLDNYKLETVSNHFLQSHKDPLTHLDIFRAYETGVQDITKDGLQLLAECGKYCVQDSDLVRRLFEKLQVWIVLNEMGKVCNVPSSYLYTKGQQIRVFSQVYKFCYDNQIVVEYKAYKSLANEEFQGAKVFDPKPDVYEYVVPFDFKSLYPTIIVAYNIDYSTFVQDDDIPDEMCHVIAWETHEKCQHTPDYDPQSTDIVCSSHRYRFLKEPRGVLPTIIQDLLDIRAKTRKYMKTIKADKSMNAQEKETVLGILNQRQLSYKVSANSMYGAMGVHADKGYLPFKAGAMSVTAMGRMSLEKAEKHLTTKYDAIRVYGDSVTGDTPLVLRDELGNVHIKTIETISNEEWVGYEGFKVGQTNRREKQQNRTKYQVWVNGKWADIKRVIRHKTKKQLYTINTHTGCVTVTEDHSLCDKNGNKIKPTEVDIGSELLHSFPKFPLSKIAPSYKRKAFETALEAQKEFFHLKSIGLHPTIHFDEMGMYWLCFDEKNYNPIAIKKIIKHDTNIEDTFVYDLETTEGKFNAGVGEMTLSNTDSIYTQFPHIPPEKLWEHAYQIQKEIDEDKIFPEPMLLEFEEAVYDPFLILTKKRYMYKTYSQDGVHGDKIGKKGVLLNRRDNSAFIRDTYREVVDMIFQKRSKDEILNYIVEQLNVCCSSQLPISDFVITKRINDKEEYKIRPLPTDSKKREKRLQDVGLPPDASQADYRLKCLPAHVQLAEKMKTRGIRVDMGQRLEYVITTRGGFKAKNFDKIEDPDYVKRFGDYVKIEHLYYVHLLSGQLDDVIYTVFKIKDFTKNQLKLRIKKQQLLDELRLCFMPKHLFEDSVPELIFEETKAQRLI